MNAVVIYASKYGATQKYAAWIAEALSCDLYERSSITPEAMEDYDVIIYGGGLYAGGVNGLSLLRKNYDLVKDKTLVLFTCGLADPTEPTNIANILAGLHKTLTPEMRQKIRVFHLRGGINYTRLTPVHKTMMAMLRRVILRKDPANLTLEEQELLRTYGQTVDFTDKSTIQPIIDYLATL
jgi:menaquinone-dependent protoporphyrinogen IX oxidase